MEYFKLIRQAFHLTIHNRILWLFGLFVIGGSNLNFLHFGDLFPMRDFSQADVLQSLLFLEEHPGWLAMLSLGLLLVSVMGLIITNWSRIMLITSVRSLVEDGHVDIEQGVKDSKRLLWPVIKVSLLTTTFMVVVAGGLLLPPLFIAAPYPRTIVEVLGLVLFLPLAFTISCVNIFATFFVVLFKRGVGTAFNLATDFFVTNWTSILGLALVLFVIYSVCFVAGASFVYLLKLLLGAVVGLAPGLGNSAVSAMMMGVNLLAGVVLWVLLAGLNVFFNTVLLLLFFRLITPIKSKQGEKVPEMVVQPATPG